MNPQAIEDECCQYHDELLQAWDDAAKESPTDLDECGMAGRGLQIVCCDSCPDITRPHQTIKQVIES